MATLTLTLDPYKHQTLLDALKESERNWRDRHFDASTGRRPSMSPEGAMMIIQDLEDLIAQVKCQSVD
jgi:hypothetical protein